MVVNSSTILEGYTLARKMVAGIDDDQDVDDGLVTYKFVFPVLDGRIICG